MYDVLTIGTGTRDVFLRSPLFKVVHDPKHLERLGFKTGEAQCFALGGKVQVDKPIMTIGGGATNAAITFARQGFKTGTLVKVGIDENGRAVLNDLKKEWIAPLPLYDHKEGTGYSVILLSPGGERTILHFAGASHDMKKEEIPFSKLKARVAYIAPGQISFSVVMAIVRTLKNSGAFIAMDLSKHYLEMGSHRLAPLLHKLDLVKINREEASYLTGIHYGATARIFKQLDQLVEGLAVMTDGPKGVLVSDGKKFYEAGIYKEKKIVDRTGAGDAFGSGFVAGLLRCQATLLRQSYGGQAGVKRQEIPHEAIKYAIRLGSANATSVVEKIGAQEGILRKKDFPSRRFGHITIHEKNL